MYQPRAGLSSLGFFSSLSLGPPPFGVVHAAFLLPCPLGDLGFVPRGCARILPPPGRFRFGAPSYLLFLQPDAFPLLQVGCLAPRSFLAMTHHLFLLVGVLSQKTSLTQKS